MSITPTFIGSVDQPDAPSFPAIAVGVAVPAGAGVCVTMAATNGASVTLDSVSDTQGNAYVKQSENDHGPHRAAIFSCDALTTALSTDDTINPFATWDNEGQGTSLHCVGTATRFA